LRQLTALDPQFLALETPRQAGHVGALAVLDPSTRLGGRLERSELTPPRTNFNGRVSPHRGFAFGVLPLADVHS
jgi:hypothetical protein